ncbi:MAG: hypothetical protein JO286_15395 [Solirubrobacterales bacterium]|nr:hypothetical protein [Solirubrobacterales bacterium]
MIQIGPGQVLEVLESSEDVLVLETTYAPGGSPPPAHFHPAVAVAERTRRRLPSRMGDAEVGVAGP